MSMNNSDADRELHPAEQWAEDLYEEIVRYDGIPEHSVSVIGMGNDNTVYITSKPFIQFEVKLILRTLGYQPREVEDSFMCAITPDYE